MAAETNLCGTACMSVAARHEGAVQGRAEFTGCCRQGGGRLMEGIEFVQSVAGRVDWCGHTIRTQGHTTAAYAC